MHAQVLLARVVVDDADRRIAELARALALGADIVGINNRDLKTLTTDLAVTERLAPSVPAGVLVISESGIKGRADVERLASHADAFMVGSSLMAAADVHEAARTLVFGRVKICGLTRAEDLEAAAAAGATHAGLIMVPGTPRCLDQDAAADLAAAAAAGPTTLAVCWLACSLPLPSLIWSPTTSSGR